MDDLENPNFKLLISGWKFKFNKKSLISSIKFSDMFEL